MASDTMSNHGKNKEIFKLMRQRMSFCRERAYIMASGDPAYAQHACAGDSPIINFKKYNSNCGSSWRLDCNYSMFEELGFQKLLIFIL